MSDLVERLRKRNVPFGWLELADLAADRIEALERTERVDALIAKQLSQSMSINAALNNRIEALEAALTDIIIYSDDPTATKIARSVLDGKRDKPPPKPDPSVPFAR